MCETAPGPRCASDTRTVCERAGSTYRVVYPKGPAVNPLGPAHAAYGDGPAGFVAPTLADPARLRTAVKPLKVTIREVHIANASGPLPQDSGPHARRDGPAGASWVAPGLGRARAVDADPGRAPAPAPAPAAAATDAGRWEPQTEADWAAVHAMYAERERARPTPAPVRQPPQAAPADFWGPTTAATAPSSPASRPVRPTARPTEGHTGVVVRAALRAAARAGVRDLRRWLWRTVRRAPGRVSRALWRALRGR